jgi:two-component system, cell cycle sensor histidine kinase and response regulator CckA
MCDEAMASKISLVVDDDASIRKFIVTVLQRDGFLTIEAENGVEALELMRKPGAMVKLLISDINMAKMDGITLAGVVRAEYPSIPILLVSGYSDIQHANDGNSGFEFLQKPFLPATIRNTVNRLMTPQTLAASAS